MSKAKVLIYILVASIASIIASCSQQKNTFVNRTFHNVTSRFNGFYYSGESLREGVSAIEAKHVDRYDKILPIFMYGDPKDAKLAYPQMEKTFLKSSLVIERHSMLIRGQEHVKWIDENYMLIGKSHFYKRDFFAALEVFDYVSKNYPKSLTRFDARLWMMRVYNEMGLFDRGNLMINILKDDKEFPKKYLAHFNALQADFYIKQELYNQALLPLSNAIILTKDRKTKTRYYFILAQLYQKLGMADQAMKFYSRVIKRNPPYEMAFNAKIKLALAFEGGSSKEIKKLLTKMLKDDKNIEFYDQINYALGEIALKEKDAESAIKYFKASIKANTNNPQQKALSYLRLGEIYYDRSNYIASQPYYDSAATFLDKDFPDFERVSKKSEYLASLVKHLNNIRNEDSLQKVAKLSPTEQDVFIKNLIDKLLDEEQKRKEAEEATAVAATSSGSGITGPQGLPGMPGAGGWYFTNPTLVNQGLTEFFKKWGNRKLEDNWRRSNKQSMSGGFDDQANAGANAQGNAPGVEGAGQPGAKAVSTVNKEVAFYKKNLPATPELLEKSNNLIIESYYAAGMIYKEQLSNLKKSAETFEELLRRFPESTYKLPAMYQLYRIYLSLSDQVNADKYKNILLRDYPESEYAKVIKNPNYEKEANISKNKIEALYEEALKNFLEKKYNTVIAQVNNTEENYPKNILMPKFELLRALSYGGMRDLKSYEENLKLIMSKYPQDPVKDAASSYLQALHPAVVKDSASAPAPSPFKFNAEVEQMVVITIKDPAFNVNSIKGDLSNFNTKNFASAGLLLNNLLLGDVHFIRISPFPNKDKALMYYNTLNDYDMVMRKIQHKEYRYFIISIENFNILYEKKNLEEYVKFFEKNYLNK